MTLKELLALPVSDLASTNAHLHLWTTSSFLPDAIKLLEGWGFEYRSNFVWVKPGMGIGNYWRCTHEILLTGIRGKAKQFQDQNCGHGRRTIAVSTARSPMRSAL